LRQQLRTRAAESPLQNPRAAENPQTKRRPGRVRKPIQQPSPMRRRRVHRRPVNRAAMPCSQTNPSVAVRGGAGTMPLSDWAAITTYAIGHPGPLPLHSSLSSPVTTASPSNPGAHYRDQNKGAAETDQPALAGEHDDTRIADSGTTQVSLLRDGSVRSGSRRRGDRSDGRMGGDQHQRDGPPCSRLLGLALDSGRYNV